MELELFSRSLVVAPSPVCVLTSSTRGAGFVEARGECGSVLSVFIQTLFWFFLGFHVNL